MANEKNAVNYRDGNQPEDLTPCCGEQPRQGWSFMGSFIWCNQCGDKIHSSTLDQWELGEKWNDEHAETPQPLSEAQAAKDSNFQHPDNAD